MPSGAPVGSWHGHGGRGGSADDHHPDGVAGACKCPGADQACGGEAEGGEGGAVVGCA